MDREIRAHAKWGVEALTPAIESLDLDAVLSRRDHGKGHRCVAEALVGLVKGVMQLIGVKVVQLNLDANGTNRENLVLSRLEEVQCRSAAAGPRPSRAATGTQQQRRHQHHQKAPTAPNTGYRATSGDQK